VSAGSASSACSFIFSGAFRAEEVDGVGDKGSGDTTVDIQSLFKHFLNMSLRSACFNDELLSGKKQNFSVLRLLFPSARFSEFWNYQMSD
jgi:hypothetical protein